jgi:hypothetical protein
MAAGKSERADDTANRELRMDQPIRRKLAFHLGWTQDNLDAAITSLQRIRTLANGDTPDDDDYFAAVESITAQTEQIRAEISSL